ncbi:MAG: hypothetical protein ACYCW6_17860, partial [Candidatus Xenobia bacterium]
KNIHIVADMAAGMGVKLPAAAQAFGKAWDGSAGGIREMRDEFGLTNQMLAQYGAHLDATGRLLTKTTKDLEAYQHALQELASTRFGGAAEKEMDTFSGSMSNLRDSITQLAQDVGQNFLPMFTAMAHGVTDMVNGYTALRQGVIHLADTGSMIGQWAAAFVAPDLAMRRLAEALGLVQDHMIDVDKEAHEAAGELRNYATAVQQAMGGGNTAESAMTALRGQGFADIQQAQNRHDELMKMSKAALAQHDEGMARMYHRSASELQVLIDKAKPLADTLNTDADAADRLSKSMAFDKTLTGGGNYSANRSNLTSQIAAMQKHFGDQGLPSSDEGISAYMHHHVGEQGPETGNFQQYAKLKQQLRQLDKQHTEDVKQQARDRVAAVEQEMEDTAATGELSLQMKQQFLERELAQAEGDAHLQEQIRRKMAANLHAIDLEQARGHKEALQGLVQGELDHLSAEKQHNQELLAEGKVTKQQYAKTYDGIIAELKAFIGRYQGLLQSSGPEGQKLLRQLTQFRGRTDVEHSHAEGAAMRGNDQELTGNVRRFLEQSCKLHKDDLQAQLHDLDTIEAYTRKVLTSKLVDEKAANEQLKALDADRAALQEQLGKKEEQREQRLAQIRERYLEHGIKQLEGQVKAGGGEDVQRQLVAAEQARIQQGMAAIDARAAKEKLSAEEVADLKQQLLDGELQKMQSITAEMDKQQNVAAQIAGIVAKYDRSRAGGANSPLYSGAERSEIEGAEDKSFGGGGFHIDAFRLAMGNQKSAAASPLQQFTNDLKTHVNTFGGDVKNFGQYVQSLLHGGKLPGGSVSPPKVPGATTSWDSGGAHLVYRNGKPTVEGGTPREEQSMAGASPEEHAKAVGDTHINATIHIGKDALPADHTMTAALGMMMGAGAIQSLRDPSGLLNVS